jgi:translation initiation factor 3 subunit I
VLFRSPTSKPDDPAPLHSAKFEIEITEMNKCTCLTWTYADEFIIAGFDSGMLVKYDPVVGKEVTRTTKLHSDRINSITWNKDKTLFITASKDCFAKIIDPYTFEVVKEIKTERPVNGAVFSPTHPHIILGGGQDAQTVTTTSSSQSGFNSRFYHMVYGEEFGRCKGHFGPINTMAIHPFGKSYATGSEDGFIRIMPFDQTYLNSPDMLPEEIRTEF